MTDETPEVPDENAAKKATKKKAARKRTTKPKEEILGEVTQTEAPPNETVADGSPEKSQAPEAEVRRISNKPGEEPVETVRARNGGTPRRNDSEDDSSPETQDAPPVIGEPASSEEGGNKRRRRRRRKGGQGEDNDEQSQQPQQPRAPRPKLDPEKVATKAWKIYLAEVSEEGLALISDQDARELSRRSFRLAEVFLEEASKHQ